MSVKAQRYNKMRILVICLYLAITIYCPALENGTIEDTKNDSYLKIYLPRELTVKDKSLTLGQVSIIRGEESLVARASNIALGQISIPGQKITFERPMILSRLACNGIHASKVTLTGSEKITVKQQLNNISSEEFVSLANSFLENNHLDGSTCKWNPIRKPRNFVIPAANKDISFSSRLVQTGARNQARIEITVLSGSKKIGVRQVTFALKYEHKQAVTTVDIPAGETINPDNIKIETIVSNEPSPADWKPPYDNIAKRRLPANTVLRSNMFESLKSEIIVKRNQNIVIRIEKPGFLITAAGKTMQDGRAGEYIKVRNMDSQRIIMARISEDGSVEPVL